MIRTLQIAASLAILAWAGVSYAQEASMLMPIEKAAVVAAQTSSPTNYALLEPIANKPVRRQLGSAGLLEPMDAAVEINAEFMSPGEGKIVVTPLSFKRGIFDDHEFKVHNASKQSLQEAKIALTAPVGSVVQQVSPKPDSVDGQSIMVTVGKIAPGEHEIVKVSINYPRNEFAKFKSMVITESWGDSQYIGSTGTGSAEAMTANQESASMLEPKMLQPQSNASAMLEPIPPQEAGMLRPKVPVIMASATTRQTTEGQVAAMDLNVAKKPKANLEQEYPTAVESSLSESSVKSYFHGPTEVDTGEVEDYRIDIQNLSSEAAEGIIIQLSIPQNLKVTVLDRDAWYDAENRKITWQLDRIKGRALETIRYKAILKDAAGSTEQVIVVGMASKVQSTSSLKTTAR